MDGFSGQWVIDHAASSSQEPLLRGLGKSYWQTIVINWVDEDFNLLYEQKDTKHVFHKRVRLYLSDGVLKKLKNTVARLIPIPMTELTYEHTFTQNEEQSFKDDAKGFGECKAITSCNEANTTFTIRWQLKDLSALMIATHSLPNPNEFRIDMKLMKKVGEKPIEVFKVYRRKT